MRLAVFATAIEFARIETVRDDLFTGELPICDKVT